jgi:hypothetical protein
MNIAVQFYLSRVAADAVDVDHLKFRARELGMDPWNAGTSYFRTQGRCRVTTTRNVAELLVTELEAMRDSATKADVRNACELALKEIAAEFAVADRPLEPATPSRNIPGHEIV